MQEQLTINHGLCRCGCGEPTGIAKWTKASLGHVKGQPVPYLPGHARRLSGPPYEGRDCGYKTECWIWLRRRNRHGYGTTGRHSLAHVMYWERVNGPVPVGLELDHLCRNPACVRPDHLESVTHTENVRRGPRTILNVDQVRAIRASEESALTLAAKYGVTRDAIYAVRRRRSWRDIE